MTIQMTQEELYAQIIANAKKVGEIAEKEAIEADENATISQNVIDAVIAGGLNRLIIPKEFGFPQIDFKTFSDLVRTIGYHNLSAAWVTYFYALHNAWVAYLPKHRMEEIYHDGGLLADIFAPIGKVEKVEGGFILNGRWNYVSGINFSEWISLGAMYRPEEGPADRIGLCMRVSELEVIQDWDSLGLRGSGSNTVIANNIFVPDDMVISFNEIEQNGQPYNLQIDENYLYYHPSFNSGFYLGFGAMCVGAAERIVDEFIERTKKRVRLTGENEGQSPKSQRVAAELSIKLKNAKGLLRDYIEMLETDQGQYTPGEYNAMRVSLIKYCLEIAVKTTSSLGASALAKGGIIEILTRDLLTISTHVTSLYEDSIDQFGKEIFGAETIAFR